MNDSQNPNAISKQQNRLAIIDKIRAVLKSELAIDPDNVYLNGVNNNEDKLVIDSRSLTTVAWDCVYENVTLDSSSETSGLFSAPYSYADEHRIHAPDRAQIAKVVNTLVEQLG